MLAIKNLFSRKTLLKNNSLQEYRSPLDPKILIFMNSILGDEALAHSLLKALNKDLFNLSKTSKPVFSEISQSHLFEPFIYKEAYKKIKKEFPKRAKKLSASEQLMLDASLSTQTRLSQIQAYLARLTLREKTVVILRDHIGLDYSAIAMVIETSTEGVILLHSQSYQKLERWIWSSA